MYYFPNWCLGVIFFPGNVWIWRWLNWLLGRNILHHLNNVLKDYSPEEEREWGGLFLQRGEWERGREGHPQSLKRPTDQIKAGSLSIAVLKPPENLVVSHSPYFICSQFCDLSCHEPSWQRFCWFYLSHLCLKSLAVWESKGRLRGAYLCLVVRWNCWLCPLGQSLLRRFCLG